MNLLFRRISILLGILILAGAAYTARNISQKKEPPKKKENPAPPIREVAVLKVKNERIASEIEVQGSLIAFNKVDIFAEVTGTLKRTARPFKVGSYFQKGAVLLDIDKEEMLLNILSQKSNLLNAITQLMPDLKIDYPESFQQWKTYLDNFNLEKAIRPFPTALNDQEKYYIVSKNLLSQYYSVKSAENRLSKYTVYAPFSGVITQANINPGSLVRAGQKMGELMGTGSYELQATVNLQDLKFIKIGNEVKLFSDAVEGQWTGTVKRISDQIDPNTQSVIIFIGVSGKDLREGMYLRGSLNTRTIENAVSIPLALLVNQNQVYTIEGGLLKLKPVEVLKTGGTHAVIRGLTDDELILKEKVIGAYDGMQVKTVSKGSGY